MKTVFDFLIKPLEKRNNNTKSINGKQLIVNTEMQNHNYVSRIGVVLAVPDSESEISVGDKVIVHHNVFRRYRDIRGKEKNSRSYYADNLFLVSPDQIYGYKKSDNWIACKGYSFIKPIKEDKMFSINFEKVGIGVLRYKDVDLSEVEEGDLVGFKPGMEYEFIIQGEKLYRVPSNKITIKYEYQGDEEEYNPSWAKSC